MALFGLLPDPPKAPDPTKVANKQLGYNTNAAQSTINMNSLDHNGPFGSSTFTKDANGNVTGQNTSLSGLLQGGSNNAQNNFTAQTGNLPTAPINFDNNTVGNIVKSNYDAYSALQQPGRDQAQKNLDVTLAERGIPIGSEVYTDAQGNMDRANSLADQSAAANFLNAAPGLQSQLDANTINQYNAPYTTAANGLGLLQGLNGLVSAAPQGSASVAAPNYTGLVANNFDQQNQQYQDQMTGINNLVSGGLGLLTAPLTGGLTGGLSNSLLGKGVSSLFNTVA
jgi:hypothetical protein